MIGAKRYMRVENGAVVTYPPNTPIDIADPRERKAAKAFGFEPTVVEEVDETTDGSAE